jgi:hypothetical protein
MQIVAGGEGREEAGARGGGSGVCCPLRSYKTEGDRMYKYRWHKTVGRGPSDKKEFGLGFNQLEEGREVRQCQTAYNVAGAAAGNKPASRGQKAKTGS